MGWQLALEVIGGPMDGLRRLLTDREVTIGRKVGQDMTLDRDRKVSNRHASVCLEGHDWCLKENREKPSKNGTSLDGKWIEPGESYPLRPGQVIVLASTAIEVLAISDTENAASPFSYDEWEDPLSLYDMTPELKDLWGRLQSHTRDKGFLDTSDLFRAIVDKERDLDGGLYECVVNIMSPECWIALGEWVVSKRLAPLYNIASRDFIVPCRIWRILDMASLDKTRGIGPKEVLQGMLQEGRSIPARYMAYDKNFLSTMDLYPPEQEIPAPAGRVTDMPPPLPPVEQPSSTTNPTVRLKSEEIEYWQKKAKSWQEKAEVWQEEAEVWQEEAEAWQKQVKDFERIILAFIEDAVIPPGVNVRFFLPDFDTRNLDMFLDASDKAGAAEYLNALKFALRDVMGAYKKGTIRLEQEMSARIREALSKSRHEARDAKGLWPIGKGDDIRKLAEDIENALKKIELEGLGERIIRQIIHSLFQNGGRR